MFRWKLLLALSAVLFTTVAAAPSPAPAQVSVNIGVAPVCPYGYFDYPPYDCAPYGYYGPDWFVGGVFPWFHGPHGFHGHVDNRYDPRNGYHGPLPDRGDRPFNHFHGNEARDGQGHVGPADHDAGREHSAGFSRVGGGHEGGHR
jgi:hypothetical protein